MKKLDLHTHSLFSDGTVSPERIVEQAREAGLAFLALTDHDTVAGAARLLAAARGTPSGGAGPAVACGIEINTRLREVHLLGYGMRLDDAALLGRIEDLGRRRVTRVERIIEKLRKLGLPVAFEEVKAVASGVMGRPHVADAMAAKGFVHNRAEAFNRYLADGRPAYVESLGPSPEEAIALIREAGGFACLAHPDTVDDLAVLGDWIRAGLEGLEAHYPTFSRETVARYAKLAADQGLLVTGGSDAHGPGTARNHALGVEVPDEACERFLERLSRCG